MNRADESVLVNLAYAKAYPLMLQDPVRYQKYVLEYAELVDKRYAVLFAWWQEQTKAEKDTWYDLMSSRYSIENSNQMRDDLINVLLEFSRAFAFSEREGIHYVPARARSENMRGTGVANAWFELRQEVWLRFCKAVHI